MDDSKASKWNGNNFKHNCEIITGLSHSNSKSEIANIIYSRFGLPISPNHESSTGKVRGPEGTDNIRTLMNPFSVNCRSGCWTTTLSCRGACLVYSSGDLSLAVKIGFGPWRDEFNQGNNNYDGGQQRQRAVFMHKASVSVPQLPGSRSQIKHVRLGEEAKACWYRLGGSGGAEDPDLTWKMAVELEGIWWAFNPNKSGKWKQPLVTRNPSTMHKYMMCENVKANIKGDTDKGR